MTETRKTDSLDGVRVAFSPEVHCRILNDALPPLGFSGDAAAMTCYVQEPADNRFSGFKTDGRLWMHYMQQMFGMDRESCRSIKRILGKPAGRPACTLDEGFEAGKRIVFRGIAWLIRRDGKEMLETETVGKVLFLIGVLAHAVQDRKHLEGNPDGINSLEHFLPPGWVHVCTDLHPPPAMERDARERTTRLVSDFRKFLEAAFGQSRGRDFFRQISSFRLPPGKKLEDYYPDDAFIHRFVPSFRPNTDIPALG